MQAPLERKMGMGTMKKIARRAVMTVAATATAVGLVAVSAPPSQAMDSSWGCGGGCRVHHHAR
jgi:hypothetical protein